MLLAHGPIGPSDARRRLFALPTWVVQKLAFPDGTRDREGTVAAALDQSAGGVEAPRLADALQRDRAFDVRPRSGNARRDRLNVVTSEAESLRQLVHGQLRPRTEQVVITSRFSGLVASGSRTLRRRTGPSRSVDPAMKPISTVARPPSLALRRRCW